MQTGLYSRLGLAALAVTASMGTALAQDKLTITLDTPPSHVRNIWVQKFADALEERSGGAMKSQIFSSGQLYSSRDAPKAVSRGDAGMAIVPTPTLAAIQSDLNVTDLPMFNGLSQEQMDRVVDGPLGQTLSEMTAEKIRVIVPGGWFVLGEDHTYSTTREINSFADLKGLQIRIPGAAGWIARYKQMGANPVNMPFTDVPLALQQGAVDAIVSTNSSIVSAKLHESGLKHAFLNRIGIGYYMPIVSREYWSSLSDDQQKLFRDTWNEFVAGQRAAALADQREARKTLEAAGMVFVEPTPEDMAQATATSAAIQDDLIRNLDISPEIVAMAREALQ